MEIALFSFFSGIGLLDLGFEDQGYNIVYVNEIHEPFLSAYKYSRQNYTEPEFGYHDSNATILLAGKPLRFLFHSMNKIRHRGDILGFIGGPPCPDFSTGGKNLGVEGNNGILTQVYCDLIRYLKPDFFLFENVKGLWKTKRHKAFYDDFKRVLQFAGYCVSDCLLNSIQYGTPQHRERVILVGILNTYIKEHDITEILGIENNLILPTFNIDWNKYTTFDNQVIINSNWPTTSSFQINSEIAPPENIPIELTVEHWFKKNHVINHPNAEHHFRPRKAISRFLTIDEGDDSRKSFKRLHRWRFSPTAAYGHNEVHLHPYQPRRLSVAESLAIQSAPRTFHLPPDISLTDMFQGVGNGVPYLLASGIAKSIKDLLLNDKETDI
jgi:DNA (cytosine-5)-methyltransferase 1